MYLHSDLRQVHLQGQFLSAVHVRIMGLLESSFQFVELEGGERGSVPTVFLLGVFIVGQFTVHVRGVRTNRGFSRAAGATNTCGEKEEIKLRIRQSLHLLLKKEKSAIN